ncbi:MAG: flippase-like domain-containing protein [Kofleriaceae bacterium]|nr:flippase-like domain-containing protein [Kofleriaceae bacterium]
MTEPEQNDDNHAPHWTKWITFGGIALAAVALTLTIWLVGARTLWQQLATIGPGFAVILLLEAIVTLCDSAALSGFLGQQGRRPSYWAVVRAQITGRAVNAVTPLGSLGEAAKATALMTETSSQRAIAAVIRYNLASAGVKLTTIGIGAPLCGIWLDVPPSLRITLFVGGGTAALIVIVGVWIIRHGLLVTLVAFVRGTRIISPIRAKAWRQKLTPIDKQLRPPKTGSHYARWYPTAWIILSRALSITSAWCVLAFSGHIAGISTMAAVATAGQMIGTVATIVPMGLGIGEGGNAALFAALGEPASVGVVMVLGGRATTLVYAAVGLVLLLTASAAESVRKIVPKRRRA